MKFRELKKLMKLKFRLRLRRQPKKLKDDTMGCGEHSVGWFNCKSYCPLTSQSEHSAPRLQSRLGARASKN